MADSAYIVGASQHGALITQPQGTPELSRKRVLVEMYFGRLKKLFPIFHHTFYLRLKNFDKFFDICCALTNFHIDTGAGLIADDGVFNSQADGFLLVSMIRWRTRNREAQQRYRQRRAITLAAAAVGEAEADDSDADEMTIDEIH